MMHNLEVIFQNIFNLQVIVSCLSLAWFGMVDKRIVVSEIGLF